jgi:hypothetical protein
MEEEEEEAKREFPSLFSLSLPGQGATQPCAPAVCLPVCRLFFLFLFSFFLFFSV